MKEKKTNYQNIARKNIYLKNHQSFGYLNSVTCNCHVLKFSIQKLCKHEYDMFLFLMAWVFGKKRKWTSTWFVSCCSVWSLGCLHLLTAHCSVLLLLLFFVDFFLFGVCVCWHVYLFLLFILYAGLWRRWEVPVVLFLKVPHLTVLLASCLNEKREHHNGAANWPCGVSVTRPLM